MKRMCRNSLFLWVITGFLFAKLWSCASSSKGASKPDKTVSTPPRETTGLPSATPPASPAAPVTQEGQTQVTYYIHTVKWHGETLSIIAGWYTDDVQNWKILTEANPDIDPKVVVVGQKINIPENIMTTRSPMTKAHVDSYYHKAGKQKPRSSPSETKDEAPTLYGPK